MSKKRISDLYKIRFTDEKLQIKNDIWKVLCCNYLQNFIIHTDTVLDIACGHGEFINNIMAKRKIGIDLNPDTRNYLNHDVEFIEHTAQEIDKFFNNEVDIVFTSNFLEHLQGKNELDLLLHQIRNTLCQNGKYIILGPNLRYLPGEYWDFYDHNLGLTHISLCEALQLSGFTIELCIDKFLPYTTLSSIPKHPLLVKAYIKFPIIWKIFGKQFFIIAKKK